MSTKNEIFIKHKKVSSIKFKFTLEPFVVEFVATLTIIDRIMKSMCFQTDKGLRYDPKNIINQRKLEVNMSGYEAEQDEILVALANSDLLEQVEDNYNTDNGNDTINLDKATVEQMVEVPTPLKGENP